LVTFFVLFTQNAVSEHVALRTCRSEIRLRNYYTHRVSMTSDTDRYTVTHVVEIKVPFV